jgi:hypothetical protein
MWGRLGSLYDRCPARLLPMLRGLLHDRPREHEQCPRSHPLATIAFDLLVATAALASVLVLAGIAVTLPSLRRL